MKNLISLVLTLIFLSAIAPIFGQDSDWEWGYGIQTEGVVQVTETEIDPQGNVLIAGTFTDSSITVDGTVYTPQGKADVYLIKFDQNDQVDWSMTVSGEDSDHFKDMVIDKNGDIILSLWVNSKSIQVGNVIIEKPVTSPGYYTALIVKLTSTGEMIWHRFGGSKGGMYGALIDVDSESNLFLTGNSYGEFEFDNQVFSPQDVYHSCYLVKMSPQGRALWGTSFSGQAEGITVDMEGGVWVTGEFAGKGIFGTVTTPEAGLYFTFVVRYDADGNFVLAKTSQGGTFYGSARNQIEADDFGNVYLTGIFLTGIFDFNGTYFSGETGNGYFYKMDLNGNLEWGKTFGKGGWLYLSNLELDPLGRPAITGGYGGGTLSIGDFTFTGSGEYDFYVVGFDTQGNTRWKVEGGGEKSDFIEDLAFVSSNEFYASGRTSSPTFSLGSEQLTFVNHTGGFVGRYKLQTKELDFGPGILFPNPIGSNDNISIVLPQTMIDQSLSITAFDMTGRLVYQTSQTAIGRNLGLFKPARSLASGTYVLTVKGDEEIFTAKFEVR